MGRGGFTWHAWQAAEGRPISSQQLPEEPPLACLVPLAAGQDLGVQGSSLEQGISTWRLSPGSRLVHKLTCMKGEAQTGLRVSQEGQMTVSLTTDIVPKRKPGPHSLTSALEL